MSMQLGSMQAAMVQGTYCPVEDNFVPAHATFLLPQLACLTPGSEQQLSHVTSRGMTLPMPAQATQPKSMSTLM